MPVSLPATPDWMSALAPNDIWGLGPAASGRHPEVLMHFDGAHWTTTPPVPGVELPTVRGMTLQDLSGITVIPGTRSMWVTGDLSGPPKGHGNCGLVLKFGP